jgi:hypothetical protein
MTTLKVFLLGHNCSVYGPIKELLGMTGVYNQATILVVAPSKAAAFGLASAMPNMSTPSRTDPEFRMAAGSDVDALAAAGQLATERVLAFHPNRSDDVVEVRVDGQHCVIGRFVPVAGYQFAFEPASGP